MPDVAVITAALTNLKTAAEIAKLIRETDASFERAEMKLRLSDLMNALAEARMQLADVQELLRDKDARIAELEEAFATRQDVVRLHDAMYRRGPGGAASGEPFCIRCWEADRKLLPLVRDSTAYRLKACLVCQSKVDGRHAPTVSTADAPEPESAPGAAQANP